MSVESAGYIRGEVYQARVRRYGSDDLFEGLFLTERSTDREQVRLNLYGGSLIDVQHVKQVRMPRGQATLVNEMTSLCDELDRRISEAHPQTLACFPENVHSALTLILQRAQIKSRRTVSRKGA